MGTLSSEQVSNYSRDGFLFPLKAFEAGRAKQVRDQLEAIEKAYAAKGPDRELSQYLRVNAHVVMPLAIDLARTPAILDAVESLLGPDILVWSTEFFIKEPGSEKVVSWHQDMTYWGLGEDADGDTEHLVSAWIALSPATSKSGCMKFVPGSQKLSIQPHQDTFDEGNLLSRGQELAVEVNPEDEVDIELAPGEFSLHHGRMFHASGPNRSGDRRIGCVIRYVTPDVRQLVGNRDYAVLLRGHDTKQNWVHVAPPDREFAPANLALYEQILRDQSVALAAGAEEGQVTMYTASAWEQEHDE